MRAAERRAAARAVGRVVRDGAWSNVVVRAEASSAGVPVGPVQGLVFDVLRRLPAIDEAIESSARRPVGRIDPPVLDLLRVGAGELLRAERPVALIVDGGVEAVRETAPRAAGFANAVLRRLSEREIPDTGLDSFGMPAFVDEALRRVLPDAEVDALWDASQLTPAVGIRTDEPPPGAEPVAGIESSWLLPSGDRPVREIVQDPASVAVGNVAAAPRAGMVVDMAAAPGGKTSHLCDQVGPDGIVVAMDVHRRRVRDGARREPRAAWVVGDGTRPPLAEAAFDLVLVDAPCSGLGTLRRRPEIRFRVTEEEVARLARVQRAMLSAAFRLVKPGGRVVYSVCTIVPAETIEVVEGLGAEAPVGLPGRPFGDGWLMAPHLGPTDGMFVASFRR